MPDTSTQWTELKAKFLREFTAAEQVFFLKQARLCISRKGYPVSEDLFYYCYFLTITERLRHIDPREGQGFMRIMLVQSMKEAQDEAKVFERRLEARKLPIGDDADVKLLEVLTS